MYLFKTSNKINFRFFQISFLAALTLNIVSANAQSDESGQLRMTQQEIINTKASGAMAPGPSKIGLYTILLKVAANTKIPAHLHPDDRVGTVISGIWYFGYGDKFDERKLKKLPQGSIYSEVQRQNHFAMTGNEAVIVEITGYGPTGVTYLNPADDPQNHKN